MTDPGALALLALLGGLLALDRGPFLQCLIARPLPAATLAGWVAGQPELGLLCGLYLEPVWMMRLQVGGELPPNETVAALASVAAAVSAPPELGALERAALGVLAGLPFGWLGMWMDVGVRKMNCTLYRMTLVRVQGGNLPPMGNIQALGATRFFLSGALSSGAGALTAPMVAQTLLSIGGEGAQAGLRIVAVLLPAIGAGAVLRGCPGWKSVAWFGLGAGAGLLPIGAGGKPWRP